MMRRVSKSLLPLLNNRFNSLSTNVVRNRSKFFHTPKRNVTPFLFVLAAGGALVYYTTRKNTVEMIAEEDDVAPQMPNFGKNVPIFRIVITGGPCAGKSSAMTKLSERLKSLGFQVFIVNEVATLLNTSGVRLNSPEQTWEQMLQNESVLLKTKMALEDGLTEIARASKKPTIILCDRGVMDSRAFLDDNSYVL
jgi:hypothetical protein